MTISPEERERRRQTLGSSDVAALLGYQYPWRTAADVQMEKLHELVPEAESPAAKVGNIVETALCQYALREIGMDAPTGASAEFSPPPILHELLPFHANLDCLVPGQCVIEAKSTGRHDDWGDPGTDQVPDGVIIQTQWQLGLAMLPVAWIPVLFVGQRRDVQLYKVEKDDALVDRLFRLAEGWWNDHVVERRMVQPEPPSLDLLKRIVRVPASSRVISDLGLVDRYRAAAKAATEAEKHRKAEQARLLAEFGDAEALVDEDGRAIATYLEHKRKGYEVEAGVYRRLTLER